MYLGIEVGLGPPEMIFVDVKTTESGFLDRNREQG